ncbi:hypothetical protein [Nostoc sp.]
MKVLWGGRKSHWDGKAIGVNLTLKGRLKTASTQAKPTSVGYKSLILS